MSTVLCGKWETFPREFAKCRRCRKAKYCGKDCQSTAWSEGHRFWCSARDGDDDKEKDKDKERDRERNSESASASASTTTRGGRDRDRERERDRDRDRDAGIRVTTDHSTDGPVVIQQQGTQTRGERTERRHHQREQHYQDRDIATERNASTAPSPTTAGPRSGSASDVRSRQLRTPGTVDGRYLVRTIPRIPPGPGAPPTRERDMEPLLASASTATAGTSPALGVDIGTSTSPGNGPPNVTIPYRARFSGPPPLVAEWETGIALGLRVHTGVPGRRLDGPGESRHRGDGPAGSDGDSIME